MRVKVIPFKSRLLCAINSAALRLCVESFHGAEKYMIDSRVSLDMAEISRRLKALALPDVDLVVGIATGGVVPASLVAFQLERPLALVQINYRAPDNSPRHPEPQLLEAAPVLAPGTRILLVDDVSVTGQTLQLATGLFPQCSVTTLALKGQADLVAFPEVGSCVRWPWRMDVPSEHE